MISELRRRAYLSAMQVASWLPRVELPFAAPSRPELLRPQVADEPEQVPAQRAAVENVPVHEAPALPETTPVPRPKIEVPRPGAQPRQTPVPSAAEAEPVEQTPAKVAAVPPPRFALQLLRAGACAVLVELPTGEALQGRDPAYLLLKDLLRAAGLPDSPQLIGEPVRWPLLARGSLDQGPQAALDYVQGFIGAQLEQEPCSCLWLVGLPATRFAGEGDAEAYNRELQVEGLPVVWAVPGLELLMDEPERKAPLWQAMRRVRQRWLEPAQ